MLQSAPGDPPGIRPPTPPWAAQVIWPAMKRQSGTPSGQSTAAGNCLACRQEAHCSYIVRLVCPPGGAENGPATVTTLSTTRTGSAGSGSGAGPATTIPFRCCATIKVRFLILIVALHISHRTRTQIRGRDNAAERPAPPILTRGMLHGDRSQRTAASLPVCTFTASSRTRRNST